jgi:hypothetical protein
VWAIALLVLCVLTSLATPYGYQLYLLPAKVMGDQRLVSAIGELHPPDFSFTRALEFVLLMTPVALVAARRKAPPLFFLALYLFFGHQAIQHVRHLPVFAVAAAPLLGWTGGELLRALKGARPRAGAEIALAVVFIGVAVWQMMNRNERDSFIDRNREFLSGESYYEQNFPRHTCDFILLNDFHGRMYNPINTAGYFIWRLAPESHKIFTDSRFDIWGDAYVWDADAIKDGGTAIKRIDDVWVEDPWWALLDKYEINFIAIGGGEGLNAGLRERGGWALVYSGGAINNALRASGSRSGFVSADNIWVRETPDNAALIDQSRKTYGSMTGIDLAN